MSVPADEGSAHWHWCVACQRAVPHHEPRCRGAPSPDEARQRVGGATLDVGRPGLCETCQRLAWRSRIEGFVLGALLGLILGGLLAVWR